MMAMMGAMGGLDPMLGHSYQPLSDDEMRRLKAYIKRQNDLSLISKGVIQWTIDGITVLAINKKNAIRKVNNIKRDLEKLLD